MTRCPRALSRLLSAVVPLAVLLLVALPARAAVIYVTNTGDLVTSGDGCSLREAVMNANGDSRAGSFECVPGSGDDVIILPPSRIQFSLAALDDGAEDAQRGDLDVTGNLTVVGGGEQFTNIDGKLNGRIFDVQSGASLTLRRLTLSSGTAAAQGGAIRVAADATLAMEETIVIGSSVTGAAARGGAIFLGPGSTTSIIRSSLRANSANSGQGGAVYCDDCTLMMHATSLTQNSASYSGGLHLQEGSADLRFVTFFDNTASTGAALHSAGVLSLLGVVSADNGNGLPGDDLLCASVPAAAQYSFVEYPATGCNANGLASGVMSRANAPFNGSANTRLLMSYSSDGRPSIIHPWSSSGARPVVWVGGSWVPQTVPSALCVEPAQSLYGGGRLVDQWGRRFPQAGDCTNGAVHDRPLFGVSSPSINVLEGDPSFAINLSVAGGNVDRTTTVVLSGLSGAADDCQFAPKTLSIPAGSTPGSIQVSPGELFGGVPELGRASRVCELSAEVQSGGDPRVVGATTGPIRIKLTDDRSTQDISTPRNNEGLDIGFVPVAAGGSASILYRAPASGWTYTVAADAISDDAAGRFSVTPVVAQPIGVSTPTALAVTCKPGGPLGNYAAVLAVSVSDGIDTTWNYQYRLGCQVGHTVSLASGGLFGTELHINEVGTDGGNEATVLVKLDSPSLVTEPFQVQVKQVVGTADAADFTLDPADGVVTFMPGDREQAVRVIAADDTLIEGAEVLVLGMAVPSVVPAVPVRIAAPTTLGLTIDSDDILTRELSFTPITGLDGPVVAGERRSEIRATLRNTGHPDAPAITGLTVRTNVDQPVWLESFVIRSCPGGLDADGQCPVDWVQANCSLEPDKRQASCSHSGAFAYGDEIEVLAVAWMADLDSAPTISIEGVMTLTASGRSDGEAVSATVSKGYRLLGVQNGSGGAAGWPFLWVAVMLAWRGSRRRFVGLGG